MAVGPGQPRAKGEARKGVSDAPVGQLSHWPFFAGAIAVWEIQRPFRLSMSASP
jgi:hypothetical protein